MKVNRFCLCVVALILVVGQADAQQNRAVPQDINQGACLSTQEAKSLEDSDDLLDIRRLSKHYAVCVEDSEEKVLELYKRAAQFGFSVDIWNLAQVLHEAGQKEQAFSLLLNVAKRGDRDSLSSVATAYLKGDGTKKNSEEAANWYENDASHCSQQSAINLALILESSKKESMQNMRALAWLLRAKDFSNHSLGDTGLALESRLRERLSESDVRIASSIAPELAPDCGRR